MKAKLNKDFIIFIHGKKHIKVENGQDIRKLPKGLQTIMKNQGLIEEDKDGNKIRK